MNGKIICVAEIHDSSPAGLVASQDGMKTVNQILDVAESLGYPVKNVAFEGLRHQDFENGLAPTGITTPKGNRIAFIATQVDLELDKALGDAIKGVQKAWPYLDENGDIQGCENFVLKTLKLKELGDLQTEVHYKTMENKEGPIVYLAGSTHAGKLANQGQCALVFFKGKRVQTDEIPSFMPEHESVLNRCLRKLGLNKEVLQSVL